MSRFIDILNSKISKDDIQGVYISKPILAGICELIGKIVSILFWIGSLLFSFIFWNEYGADVILGPITILVILLVLYQFSCTVLGMNTRLINISLSNGQIIKSDRIEKEKANELLSLINDRISRENIIEGDISFFGQNIKKADILSMDICYSIPGILAICWLCLSLLAVFILLASYLLLIFDIHIMKHQGFWGECVNIFSIVLSIIFSSYFLLHNRTRRVCVEAFNGSRIVKYKGETMGDSFATSSLEKFSKEWKKAE